MTQPPRPIAPVPDLLPRAAAVGAAALQAGALVPLGTTTTLVADGPLPFRVHLLERLTWKVRRTDDLRAAGSNPFLPPEPALCVADLGPTHRAVLNKFPVVADHILIVTRAFEHQQALLTRADCAAAAACLASLDGLVFYNGGAEAGASQAHKHLQIIPLPLAEWPPDAAARAEAGLPELDTPEAALSDGRFPLEAAWAAAPDDGLGTPSQSPWLPFRHALVHLHPARGDALADPETDPAADPVPDPVLDPAPDADTLHAAFTRACVAVGLTGLAPIYNLLLTRRHLLVVPRVRERTAGVALNALAFAGSLLVPHPALLETVRRVGPLRLLRGVVEHGADLPPDPVPPRAPTLAEPPTPTGAPMNLDPTRTRQFVDAVWTTHIVPALVDYIRIPCQSPHFDADWAEAGHMDAAVKLIADWLQAHLPAGASLEVVRLPGRTPLIFAEIPGASDDTVLLYGHLDKQPEMVGWDEDKGPWTPVFVGDKLYGRGGADDGYAAFASLTAINALRDQGLPHARCVLMIEACEESGSYDLPAYVTHLAARIGQPSLVICLDSGAGNYEQLWSTTSLRGLVGGTLKVELLREGVHSGAASGIVPSTFRIARILLDRLEDPLTGLTRLPVLRRDPPAQRIAQTRAAAAALGDAVWTSYPFIEGAQPCHTDAGDNALAGTWQATLSVTGMAGLPTVKLAGNVLRPQTSLQLSLRLPPNVAGADAYAAIKAELERDPPYGARVTFEGDFASGWDAPALAPWLAASSEAASQAFFGKPCLYRGEGGTIPFMGMLGQKFPQAQFLITGVLGPASNAHGPNEFLHIPYARTLTAAVAAVLADHFTRPELGT